MIVIESQVGPLRLFLVDPFPCVSPEAAQGDSKGRKASTRLPPTIPLLVSCKNALHLLARRETVPDTFSILAIEFYNATQSAQFIRGFYE